jgi:ribonuclease-3
MSEDITIIESLLAHSFKDKDLLRLALTHRSAADIHNERLEFLGDSLLNMIIAEKLFTQFPSADEGELTRLRSSLVSGSFLATVAKKHNIGEYIHLGKGEQKTHGASRPSILAGCVEAIIGALYIEGGFDLCREKLLAWFKPYLENLSVVKGCKDPKTLLQEYLQSIQKPLPIYKVVDISGRSHNQEFTIECHVSVMSDPAIGVGPNKRTAEQEAALKVIKDLDINL